MKKLNKYECLYETLDWDGNKAKLRRDREFLASLSGVTFQRYVIEDGDPMEGAGAGILVRVRIEDYQAAFDACYAHQMEQLGSNGFLSRYGLSITDEL